MDKLIFGERTKIVVSFKFLFFVQILGFLLLPMQTFAQSDGCNVTRNSPEACSSPPPNSSVSGCRTFVQTSPNGMLQRTYRDCLICPESGCAPGGFSTNSSCVLSAVSCFSGDGLFEKFPPTTETPVLSSRIEHPGAPEGPGSTNSNLNTTSGSVTSASALVVKITLGTLGLIGALVALAPSGGTSAPLIPPAISAIASIVFATAGTVLDTAKDTNTLNCSPIQNSGLEAWSYGNDIRDTYNAFQSFGGPNVSLTFGGIAANYSATSLLELACDPPDDNFTELDYLEVLPAEQYLTESTLLLGDEVDSEYLDLFSKMIQGADTIRRIGVNNVAVSEKFSGAQNALDADYVELHAFLFETTRSQYFAAIEMQAETLDAFADYIVRTDRDVELDWLSVLIDGMEDISSEGLTEDQRRYIEISGVTESEVMDYINDLVLADLQNINIGFQGSTISDFVRYQATILRGDVSNVDVDSLTRALFPERSVDVDVIDSEPVTNNTDVDSSVDVIDSEPVSDSTSGGGSGSLRWFEIWLLAFVLVFTAVRFRLIS